MDILKWYAQCVSDHARIGDQVVYLGEVLKDMSELRTWLIQLRHDLEAIVDEVSRETSDGYDDPDGA